MINRAYIEVMTTGDAKGRVFTFPIPTYNMTPDFPWESENATLLFEMTAKYGLPYFQNFINSELKPNMIRSMCCRLQLDLRELLKRGNGLFGSAEQTGSVGVVTINCARLGYPVQGRRGGPAAPSRRACWKSASNSLEIKRKVIQRLMDNGPVPLHQALPRHAAQPLLDHRRQRHQRDDPQLHRRRARHHHRLGPCVRGAAAGSHPWPHRRVPGRDRPHVQPGSHAGRRHHLPLRQGGPQALSRTSCRRAPRTCRTTPTRRSCRWGSPTIPFEALERQDELQTQVHRRHRAASVHVRAHFRRGSLQATWCAARWSASACPTSPSRRLFRSAPNTAIWLASTSSAPSATRKPCPANVLLLLNPRRLI